MSEPTSPASPQLFPVADAAHAALQPLKVVHEYLGGQASTAVHLTEAQLIDLLQYFERLPEGIPGEFWLTPYALAGATNRRPHVILSLIDARDPAEPYDTQSENRLNARQRRYGNATLIWLLQRYNFLPSPEFREFSATAVSLEAALGVRFGYRPYTVPRISGMLATAHLEHRFLNQPRPQKRLLACYREHEAMAVLVARVERERANRSS